MIHEFEIHGRYPEIPFIKVVKNPCDDSFVIGSIFSNFDVSGIVGWDANKPEQFLRLLWRQHVIQQRPLLQ